MASFRDLPVEIHHIILEEIVKQLPSFEWTESAFALARTDQYFQHVLEERLLRLIADKITEMVDSRSRHGPIHAESMVDHMIRADKFTVDSVLDIFQRMDCSNLIARWMLEAIVRSQRKKVPRLVYRLACAVGIESWAWMGAWESDNGNIWEPNIPFPQKLAQRDDVQLAKQIRRAEAGSGRMVEYLLGREVAINCKDHAGATPLHYALSLRPEFWRSFPNHCLPLLLANKLQVVRVLLQNGANVQACYDPNTPQEADTEDEDVEYEDRDEDEDEDHAHITWTPFQFCLLGLIETTDVHTDPELSSFTLRAIRELVNHETVHISGSLYRKRWAEMIASCSASSIEIEMTIQVVFSRYNDIKAEFNYKGYKGVTALYGAIVKDGRHVLFNFILRPDGTFTLQSFIDLMHGQSIIGEDPDSTEAFRILSLVASHELYYKNRGVLEEGLLFCLSLEAGHASLRPDFHISIILLLLQLGFRTALQMRSISLEAETTRSAYAFFGWPVGEHRKAEVIRKLIEAGQNPIYLDKYLDGTPLHYAIRTGQSLVAKKLLNLNANVSMKDFKLREPLHLAAYHGDVEMAREILARGADVMITDCWISIR
ncbi:ankyrin [Ascobolus immersus RN42]|uniref:Ankyrin n=1 Tax=Ascobolus immersus RN42 TaxID=1160509 RepID=A0A3N4HG10_ASCIM|nr:ankyrin [Ascobolus immersus RN42]